MITKGEFEAMTPEKALRKLQEGNARFVEGRMLHRDHADEIASTSGGQNPFALVHGCIDSRTPAERIFDQGIGDIFHTRIAGNVINEDVLGSMEYACGVVGTPLIVVMGHTSCGAIRGAYEGVEMGNLTGLLEKISPSIEAARSEAASVDSNFPDLVARTHAKRMLSEILSRSKILKELVEQGKVMVTAAMYDVTSGKAEIFGESAFCGS